MEIDINKIVSSEDLAIDTQFIKSKLNELNEIIVFESNKPQFVILSLEKYYQGLRSSPTKLNEVSEKYDVKIGEYVQDAMRRLFNEKLISEDEIKRLTSKDYSNDTFNINFPVLKLLDKSLSIDNQKRDSKGYNRYYKYTLYAYGNEYFLCSQWLENLHRKKFELWLTSFSESNSQINF
jgi:hypothetical protein